MATLIHTASGPHPGHRPDGAPAGQHAAVARPSAAGRPPVWLYVVVIIGALGVLSLAYSALFSPATILGPGQHMTASARTWAHYAVPYVVALAAALLIPLAIRAWRVLAGTLVQAAFAEALLGIAGIINHRPEQVARPTSSSSPPSCCAPAACTAPQTRPPSTDPPRIPGFPARGPPAEFTDQAPDDDHARLGARLELRAEDPAA